MAFGFWAAIIALIIDVLGIPSYVGTIAVIVLIVLGIIVIVGWFGGGGGGIDPGKHISGTFYPDKKV